MAPLASIPEANNSLHSTFDTHRPRSRVVFLSRGPGRSRCSVRKSPFARRFQRKSPEDADLHNATRRDHRREPTNDASPSTVGETETPSASTNTLSDTSPKLRRHLHKSESPFDLDSFPEPPSINRDMHPEKRNPHIVTHSTHKNTAPKPPLALSQRKLLVPGQQGPTNIRHGLMDAATDVINPSRRQSVDSALVAAVSRSIAQQFRLISKYSVSSSSQNDKGSRSSSQRNALNRFTRDLETFAQQASAKGKVVNTAPTPPVDTTTLHTISDLLPYRPQLRAAGLAVTSKEQGQGVPHYLNHLQPGLPPPTARQPPHHNRCRPGQLDGYNGSGPLQSSGTEISFAKSQDIDEFRYALIAEAPVRKKKQRSEKKKPTRRRCLPCFPAEEDLTTDTDWAHFKAPSTRPTQTLQKRPQRDLRGNQPTKMRSNPTRMHNYIESTSHSPHQQPATPEVESTGVEDLAYQWDRPNFITTGQRHSMTVPKPIPQDEACYIEHRHRHGKDSQGRLGKDSKANLNYSKPFVEKAVGKRRPAHPAKIGVQPNLSTEPSQSQPEQLADVLFDGRTEGQQGRRPAKEPLRPRRQRPPRSTRIKKRPTSQYDPYHIGICCPKSRGVPAKLTARPNIPRRTSSIQGSVDSIEVDYDDREISDRDVLRGLHVAASAACNEEIDAFVKNKTGLRIRWFLADLMALETLTAVRPGEDDEQHARRRRAEMRKLKQQVRRSREVVMAGGLI